MSRSDARASDAGRGVRVVLITAPESAARDLARALVGDGALAMSLQDLDTIRRENLPVLILVLDDGGYGAEVHYSANRGIPDEHAYIDSPSFVDVASAFGFDAREVETLDGGPQCFDRVVLALHSDQALRRIRRTGVDVWIRSRKPKCST